jgi:tRNA(Ile)-lysidine synthase
LDPDHLFDPAQLSRGLIVRNWRPGDRFWPAHTKSHKKIKELLQEKHVPQTERKLWPVVVSGDEIVWLRGFPGRAQFRPAEDKKAVLITEQELSEADGEY